MHIPAPYFLIDETKLIQNLEILRAVADEADCKILLAQKAYSIYQTYPLLARYLAGTAASGVFEARLGREYFPGEVHAFSPAFRDKDVQALVGLCDHIVFNTPAQVRRYAPACRAAGVSVGLRVNPERSTQEGHAIYDPCAPGSRLGTTLANFEEDILPLLDGLHFHTLCEQNADALEQTAAAFCEKFGKYAARMRWLNLGGGHHITRDDYDRARLVRVVRGLREKYGARIYLEPGEAVVLDAGTLHAHVLETMHNGMDIAILDVSAACHTPRGRRQAGRKGAHLPPGRAHLPRGRRHRRLFLRFSPARRGRARVRRHGAVHHGQDQHLQRYAAARHPLSPCRRERRDAALLRV